MSEGRLAEAVRQHLGLGRIVPLGGPVDGVWITESAAVPVLRGAAESVGGVRVRSLRIGPADGTGTGGTSGGAGTAAGAGTTRTAGGGGAGATPTAVRTVTQAEDRGTTAEGGPDPASGTGRARNEAERVTPPAVPPPPSALPHGPLRVDASFDAALDRPLADSAELVRSAVARAADEALGLVVTAVDLRIGGLLDEEDDEPPGGDGDGEHPGGTADGGERGGGGGGDRISGNGRGAGRAAARTGGGAPPGGDPAHDAATAARGVPGVAALVPEGGGVPSGSPGARAPGVRLDDRTDPAGRDVRTRITVSAGYRALDVALAVRRAVAEAVTRGAPGPVTVAVLVTAAGTEGRPAS